MQRRLQRRNRPNNKEDWLYRICLIRLWVPVNKSEDSFERIKNHYTVSERIESQSIRSVFVFFLAERGYAPDMRAGGYHYEYHYKADGIR